MFTKAFMRALGERAVKTFCQTMGALMLAAQLGLSTQIIADFDWALLLSMLWTAGVATLLSVMTTIGSGLVTGGNASLVRGSEVTTDNGLLHLPAPDDDDGRPVL